MIVRNDDNGFASNLDRNLWAHAMSEWSKCCSLDNMNIQYPIFTECPISSLFQHLTNVTQNSSLNTCNYLLYVCTSYLSWLRPVCPPPPVIVWKLSSSESCHRLDRGAPPQKMKTQCPEIFGITNTTSITPQLNRGHGQQAGIIIITDDDIIRSPHEQQSTWEIWQLRLHGPWTWCHWKVA